MRLSFLELLRQHRLFIIPFLLFAIFAFSMQGSFSQADLFLLFNAKHHPVLDEIFIVLTWLGDGLLVLIVGIGFCLVKYRYSVLTLLAFIYSSTIIRFLKLLFQAPRPVKFFEGKVEIRTIPGFVNHHWNSYPSGHSASAFVLAVILIHILPYKYRSLIIFPLALLIIVSRVYLAQHFFEDIVAGSILGTLLTFQTIWWLENTDWYHASALEGRLFKKKAV